MSVRVIGLRDVVSEVIKDWTVFRERVLAAESKKIGNCYELTRGLR